MEAAVKMMSRERASNGDGDGDGEDAIVGVARSRRVFGNPKR
jgi:hypothetical protein